MRCGEYGHGFLETMTQQDMGSRKEEEIGGANALKLFCVTDGYRKIS
jgi:hypothetical protein